MHFFFQTQCGFGDLRVWADVVLASGSWISGKLSDKFNWSAR